MKLFFAILSLSIMTWTQLAEAADKLSLAGTWNYQLDPGDSGIGGKWFGQVLQATLVLPGSLPGQGIGYDITENTPWTAGFAPSYNDPKYAPYRQPGNIKIPFFLQPDKYYAGPCWYQRQIDIPTAWNGLEILLSLERPHWGTTVWVDGVNAGRGDSLSTPHQFNLGSLASGAHLLSIRVDNRAIIPIGANSSSITDHTQGNWNGIIGDISLTTLNPLRFNDVQVYSHVLSHSVTIKGSITNINKLVGNGKILITIADRKQNPPLATVTTPVSWNGTNISFSVEAALGADAPLWDEFTPEMLDLAISLSNETTTMDSRQISFGLRELITQGTQFLLNGRKIFFRGTTESCIFPNSGHPPMDIDSWRRIISIAKKYGFNLFRFHTWCPPEVAFQAADELGFYLHIECASWGLPGTGTPLDAWLYTETERILKTHGNHPSFLFMASGNEPAAYFDLAAIYFESWLAHFKPLDTRRLFVGSSGYPETAEDQFHVSWEPRITILGLSIYSFLNAYPPQTTIDYHGYINSKTVPSISHEIGEWSSYPDLSAMSKYTNYLKPKNLEIFRDFMVQHQIADLAPQFLQASGRLQVMCYKEEIEAALRTPGMGGFHLLGLTDFTGQGSAPIGVLDAFWNEKGYITAAEYSRFCNITVPLVRLPKRVFTVGETLNANAEVAHFGAAPLPNVIPAWTLTTDNGVQVASGTLPTQTIPVGNGFNLGTVHIEMAGLASPARYKLTLGLSGTRFTNDWEIWVYPSEAPADPPGLPVVTKVISSEILSQLTNGASVLLNLPLSQPGDTSRGRVKMAISTIFWDTAWFNDPPTTLGILCDPANPVFKYFPTDFHSNWQWWYLLTGAEAMDLDGLPSNLATPIRAIDDWLTARRLGMLFEARVGKGKLVVCSIDLLNTNMVSRQFRYSLLKYMTSSDFAPQTELSLSDIRGSILGLLPEPPVFLESPQDQLRTPGRSATFNATVGGTPPIDYAWFHGRVQVAVGTSIDRKVALTIPHVSTADTGSYTLRVSNPYGTFESTAVSLGVLETTPGTFLQALMNLEPIAYWRFDDEMPNFAGTLDVAGGYFMQHANVSASPGPTPPQFNGFSITNVAGAYNGMNSGSVAPKLTIGNLSRFSIAGWFNPNHPLEKLRTALFGQNNFAELGFHDLVDNPNGVLGIWIAGPKFSDTGYGTLVTVTNKDGLLTPGKWYFLVITADSSLISLYLDGSLAARASGSVLNTYNSLSPFRAGFGTLDETGNNFDGKIDEIAVFDRALASDEINLLYQTAVGFPQQKLNASQIKGQIVLDWTSGTLQVSDSITGPFTNILQATSPYTNSITDRSRFYRLLEH